MVTLRRRRSPLARAALPLVLALAATATAVAHGATAAAPTCAAPGLVVWLDTAGSGAAGSFYYDLHFTNLTGRPCSLRGFPHVAAVDVRGHRVGRPAERDAAAPLRTVVLRPGASVTAVVQITDVAAYPPASCRPTTVAGLRVSAPHGRRSTVVAFPFRACTRGPVTLHVRSVGTPA